jgi:hypothetical protein
MAIIALMILPLAAAHDGEGLLKPGEYIDHGKEAAARLDPGEWQNYTLAFGGGPMWEGWFFVIYGDSDGQTAWSLVNHASEHGSVTDSWTWNGSGQMQIGQFPEEGVYELRVHNIGAGEALVRWSYDQTCDCTFKPMPFSGAYAWFNPYMEAGQEMEFTPGAIVVNATDPTTTDEPVAFTATHATWSGYGSSWDTFNIHANEEINGTMIIIARETGVQYILMQLETKDDARGLLLYSFEVKEEGKETPFIGVGATILLLTGLLRVRGARKRFP